MSAQAKEGVRRFIAAALCDLISDLSDTPSPIIIGGNYPNDKLIDAFTAWLIKRGIDVADPATEGWLHSCLRGDLQANKEQT